MSMIRLHQWHSSSTSFRVRIALGLKRLTFERINVTLKWENADHDTKEYGELNPQRNIPVLEDHGVRIMQSLAIIDYLDLTYPEPPLYPKDAAGRARVLSIALHVTCEIQPMNNLRVQRYLVNNLKIDADANRAWQQHWIGVGFDAIEQQLQSASTGAYCHGDTPTVADCCLVPQVYNALRPAVGADISRWPTIQRIYNTCLENPIIHAALPTSQPDFESPSGH
ncbi:MAG TPA: maleylacetoacetate isomerase [Kofleriaceae bacterium]|nr:maleylacetoacetate isomerase [Kofleriaceae bacterium]